MSDEPVDSDTMELGDVWPPHVVSSLDMLLLSSPPSGQHYLDEFIRRWGGYYTASLLRVLHAGD